VPYGRRFQVCRNDIQQSLRLASALAAFGKDGSPAHRDHMDPALWHKSGKTGLSA